MNQKICGSHKRYDELFAILKGKDHKLREMEDQLELLKKQEELIKASDKESEGAKVGPVFCGSHEITPSIGYRRIGKPIGQGND